MANPDLHEAAARMTRLIEAVPDDAMNAPTPCPDLPLGALIDHVGGFAKVFTASATKEIGERTAPPPDPRADNLEPGWRPGSRLTSPPLPMPGMSPTPGME